MRASVYMQYVRMYVRTYVLRMSAAAGETVAD